MKNELGNKYALAALKNKRASLAGQLAALEKQVAWTKIALDKISDAIPIFQPGFDPKKIAAKRPRIRTKLFSQGDLSRTIVDVLREEGGPLSSTEIVTRLMKKWGHKADARAGLSPRVVSSLHYLVKGKGDVIKTGPRSERRYALTRFAQPVLIYKGPERVT